MNKRERLLLGLILFLAFAMLHLWLGQKYMDELQTIRAKKTQLEADRKLYSSSPAIAATIENEVEWLRQNKPTPSTIQETQSKLQEYITTSSEKIGFETYGQKPIELDVTDGTFEKVKMQVSARATEKELYQWIIDIHKPSEFRAVTYLRLTPDKNDLTQVITTIAAEQTLTN